ncbi:iron ABC transporter permease [Alkalihalophilus lindianensis]|uniref:Iron ABC transporter permease n=1 Tax=Alkalihalophilus lindianensis TaxID=1630542 RepID=A0ABU3XF84_9BACI|nr:iron ABC transporter permease [Alkalihalophilus lindianensis]MDV2686561.1 iron ABC transporter permease [Alkalihalophilus lindianensis]
MEWIAAFKESKKPFLVILLFILGTFIFSLQTGVLPISISEIGTTLRGEGTPQHELILFQLRLPRMIIALLIGAGLAVSGAILQGLSRNSLADPGILGINAGAGLAVVLCIFLFKGNEALGIFQSPFMLPLFAFCGALTVAMLIYTFSWKDGVDPGRLLLIGIGFNALCGALLIIVQLKMDPRDFQEATIWLTGSIWGTQWRYVYALLPWIVILLPFAFFKAKTLNLLQISDPIPYSLGMNVEFERRLLLSLAAALAGACVAVGGGISFLGLLAPHLARRLTGPNYFSLLPASALIGMLILLLADMIGKNILAPADIPVGIVISIIGAPYLIYMLLNRRGYGFKT